MIQKHLAHISKGIKNPSFTFSTDIVNFRVPLVDPATHKPTDEYIHKYENNMFSAYLEKRKITRSQIWPKIYILDEGPQEEKPHLKCQTLFTLKKALDDDFIKKIARDDPTQINSAFIISMFSEDYFKEMIDEYVKKVVVCGKAPSQAQSRVEEKVKELFRIYYFGEELSPLERQIETFYLATKQEKSLKKKIMPKNAYYRCNWRSQDQRLLEDVKNWPEADLNLSDLSFRYYYLPMRVRERLPFVEKFYMLAGGDSFLNRFTFNLTVKKEYSYEPKYVDWICGKILSRTIHYTKCIEFTHRMRIPPDYMIETCIINIHMWLIISRLRQFNTKLSSHVAENLNLFLRNYIDASLGSLNIKKMSMTKKTFHEMVEVSTNVLNLHFTFYEETKKNPYLNIDALVWSCAFREKVERYGPEVYLFSEYLVKNWEHIQRHSEQQILDAVIEFEPCLGDPDYVQKIQEVSPPMNKEQFEVEFNSDKLDKAYYYKMKQSNEQFRFDFDKVNKDLEYSLFRTLIEKAIRMYNKYFTTLEKYDHFSDMDEQRKQAEEAKKNPWKGDSEKITRVEEEFEEVGKIRRSRKSVNSSSKDK